VKKLARRATAALKSFTVRKATRRRIGKRARMTWRAEKRFRTINRRCWSNFRGIGQENAVLRAQLTCIPPTQVERVCRGVPAHFLERFGW
jgi:hypothetical protein